MIDDIKISSCSFSHVSFLVSREEYERRKYELEERGEYVMDLINAAEREDQGTALEGFEAWHFCRYGKATERMVLEMRRQVNGAYVETGYIERASPDEFFAETKTTQELIAILSSAEDPSHRLAALAALKKQKEAK